MRLLIGIVLLMGSLAASAEKREFNVGFHNASGITYNRFLKITVENDLFVFYTCDVYAGQPKPDCGELVIDQKNPFTRQQIREGWKTYAVMLGERQLDDKSQWLLENTEKVVHYILTRAVDSDSTKTSIDIGPDRMEIYRLETALRYILDEAFHHDSCIRFLTDSTPVKK